MSMNKSEKCPNTIGTINLSPQFNRPQQGLLYALHTTKRKSKQQAEAKQHSKTRTAEARFFRPHFNVADHFYVMLCTRRGEVPSISVVAWSLSSPENNAPQNTLEQQVSQLVSAYTALRNDLKHKIGATQTDNKKLGTCTQHVCLRSAADAEPQLLMASRTHSIRQKFSRITTCSTPDTLA